MTGQPESTFVAGRWRVPQGPVRTVENPATEETLTELTDATTQDVDDAVDAARRARSEWAASTAADRAAILGQLADRLEARSNDVASTINQELGAPNRLAERLHAALPVTVLRDAADLVTHFPFEEKVGNSLVVREPAGVVAAITPWNYPLHQPVVKLAAAFAAGCTVVLKPAELTPLTGIVLAECVADTDLPAGAFNLVTGSGTPVGSHLVEHPGVDMVSFTGSVTAGTTVAATAVRAVKKVSLELGGKSASLICRDIGDELLATAVKVSLANCLLNSGQTCTAWTRLLVPRSLHERVTDLLLTQVGKYTPGERLGPLISGQHRDRVLGHIEAAVDDGARVLTTDADLPSRGYYVAPTILTDVDPASRIAQEEVFGPVLTVCTYDTEDEAIAIANGTRYGLAGAVWCDDTDHALAVARALETGQVDVNGGAFNPRAPFGGRRQSGIGRELGTAGLEELLEYKAIQQ